MARILLVGIAVLGLGLAVPGSAPARIVYGGQMNISTGERLFDDTSIVQYAAPRRLRTRIAGKLRKAGMGVNTICCRTDRQLLRETNRFGVPPRCSRAR